MDGGGGGGGEEDLNNCEGASRALVVKKPACWQPASWQPASWQPASLLLPRINKAQGFLIPLLYFYLLDPDERGGRERSWHLF